MERSDKTAIMFSQWPDLKPPPMYEKPAKGWKDPGMPDMRLVWKLAGEVGYSIGIHGSLLRDMDLIAVPWIVDAVKDKELVAHLCKGLNAKIVGKHESKPHNRIAVILQIDGWYKPIDLSIMPIIPKN